MQRSYARLKRENPQSSAVWDEGTDALLAGDHYLLVMWDASAASRVTAAALIGLAVKVLIPLLIFVLALWALSRFLGSAVHLGSILFVLLVLVVALFSVLHSYRPKALDWLMRRTLLYLFGRKDAEKSSLTR